MDRYVIETDATVMDIDGDKWIVTIIAFDYGSPEAKHLASQTIGEISVKYENIVTGIKNADGAYSFACSPELEEKIKSKIRPDHKWKRFRIDSQKTADFC